MSSQAARATHWKPITCKLAKNYVIRESLD